LLDTAKPVPAITAKAINLLRRLGDAFVAILNDEDTYAQKALFYLPLFNRSGKFKPQCLSRRELNDCMDRFCDYVGLPPDELGRRWYLRIHELRKSFLITFFWCFKFSSLDAARWIAGHSNEKHIYDYIQSNFPGEELPQLEAEYAAQQLWDFSHFGAAGETENIKDLYRAVCRHFGVTEIELVDRADVERWLEIAFRKGLYSIRPFRIVSQNGLIKTSVVFKIQEKNIDA
jgi:hypothetical protein